MKKKAQVTVYIFSAIATLVIISFVIINIGKTAKDKTHADNAADAAALAGCSVMAQAFNYNSDDNNSQHKSQRQYDNKDRNKEQDDNRQKGNKGVIPHDIQSDIEEAGDAGAADPWSGQSQAASQKQHLKAIEDNMKHQENTEDDAKEKGEKNDDDTRKAMDDYHGQALYMAYMLNFQNSGTQHRLGKINQKRYAAFLQQITPETVQSGMPYTFFYVDGAARAHMVTAIVETEDVNNVETNTESDSYSDQKNDLQQGQRDAQVGQGNASSASGTHAGAQPTHPKEPGASMERSASATHNTARGNGESAVTNEEKFNKGRQITERKTFSQENQNDNEVINYREDISHSRTVRASNFQFHMGSPIKSINADIDMVTFYPPVQSSAIASFNYTGQGNIKRSGGEGSDPRHECGLVAAF